MVDDRQKALNKKWAKAKRVKRRNTSLFAKDDPSWFRSVRGKYIFLLKQGKEKDYALVEHVSSSMYEARFGHDINVIHEFKMFNDLLAMAFASGLVEGMTMKFPKLPK